MAGNETTFNNLLAIKAGGGNPGAPGPGDILNLTFGSVGFTSSLQINDGPLGVGFNSENAFVVDDNYAFLGPASGVETYNLTLYGILGAQGVSTFTHTGGTTNEPDFQVDGYAKLAGAVELGSDLKVAGNAQIEGNLVVKGTTTTINTETLLVADNYGDFNWNLTSGDQDTGLTFNYAAIASSAITAFTNGDTIVVSAAIENNKPNPAIPLAVGDIIVVAGMPQGLEQNEGFYEVASIANNGTEITVNTTPSLTFLKGSLTNSASPGQNATAAWIELGVFRVDGQPAWGAGSNVQMPFGYIPYDGYAGMSQNWTADLNLTGDLKVAQGANTSYALALETAAGDASVSTGGKLYVKTVNGADELWYNHVYNNVSTPIQITAGNAVNTSSTSLQSAYNTGASILTQALVNNDFGPISFQDGTNGAANALEVSGAVSITDNSNGALDALAVTGSTNLSGSLDVSGDISLTNGQAVNVFSVAAATGNTVIGGTLTGSGDVSINDAQATPKFTVAAATGNTVISGTMYNYGNITSEGDIALVDQSAATTFSVSAATGNTVVGGSLDVSGWSNFKSDVYVWTNGGQTNTFSIASGTGNVWTAGTLEVLGATTLRNDLSVMNVASINNAPATSYSILLDRVENGDPGQVFYGGKLYSKDMTTNNVAIPELFYAAITSSGWTPLQLTKDGLINASLQNAYLVGSQIDVQAFNGTSGGSFTLEDTSGGNVQTLRVNGTTYLNGTLDVTNDLSVLDSNLVPSFSVDAPTGNTDIAGTLDVGGGSVCITETATSPTPDPDTGCVFVKEDPNAAGHSELWYYGDGTNGAVMITKDGALNINNSLQGAYDDGSTITTALPNSGLYGPVTINDGSAAAYPALRLVGGFDVLDPANQAVRFFIESGTGNTNINGNLTVDGILDLNGSVDADVTGFDLLSSGDVSIEASGILSLKGPAVTSNIDAVAGVTIDANELVKITTGGLLVQARADAQNVVPLGVAVAQITNGNQSGGLIAEFGLADIKVETGFSGTISAGDRLYLSTVTAGTVTNVEPTAAGSTVFQVGVALSGIVSNKVKVALRPQFMYNVY